MAFSPEQIVNKLREADVLLGQGLTVLQVCKRPQVPTNTHQNTHPQVQAASRDHPRAA